MVFAVLKKEWLATHKMPKSATLEQRIDLHTEHLKHCQCRTDYPEKLKIEMKT